MKFQVTMKDPDCLHDAIRDAVKEDLGALKLDADSITHAFAWRLAQLEEQWVRSKKARRALGIGTRALASRDFSAANLAVEVARSCLDGRSRP